MNKFQKSVSALNRVGEKTSSQLKKIGITTVRDLLQHYPFRYEDYSQILSIEEFKTKKRGTIKVKVNLIANRRSNRKKMTLTEAIVSDNSGSLQVLWFNQGFLAKNIKPGQQIYLAGTIDDSNHGLQLINPSYEICYSGQAPLHTGRLVPIYSTTSRLTQKQIRFLVSQSLKAIWPLSDWLPSEIKKEYQLIELKTALQQIHFPQNLKTMKQARQRLKFNELFLLQFKNQLLRQRMKKEKAPLIKFQLTETQKLIQSLPFKLTDDQKKASWEIIKDLEKGTKMNRLLEGDVGSGKTIAIVIAILNVVLNGYQVSYMAPTGILAQQQFQNISQLLKKIKIKIGLLTSSKTLINDLSAKKNKEITKNKLYNQIEKGELQIIIGTHSLIEPGKKKKSKKLTFQNLGLIVVDEQHRFGVKQRQNLSKLSNQNNLSPHFLSLTATPIPRSIALTLYSNLDLSVIKEMPAKRKKIITEIVTPEKEKETYQFIKKEIKKGRQAFVICPLIEKSLKSTILLESKNESKSVNEEYKKLSQKIFPQLKVDFIHGKMKEKEKEEIMQNFTSGQTNLLIATTVLEVGIDIPNASLMLIKGAEHFGLAQLHQLRGRVGRGSHQSYCFLFTDNESPKTKKRLSALLKAKDGFELAQKDLELRGPGEILSIKQSGFSNFLKIAEWSDTKLIQETKAAVKKSIKKYPRLTNLIKKDLQESVHLE
ncbi:ATP-dependent DNA helicase RecG [Patescibacteria group bacterium]|nr:ATP-dependent DNA helicase RecG [Patescibacteria group bacterium]